MSDAPHGAIEDATHEIVTMLGLRAEGWQVEVSNRELGGRPAAVVTARHPQGKPSQWAFTAASAQRAVEMVDRALRSDADFQLAQLPSAAPHRALLGDIARVADLNGWSVGAMGELSEALVHHGLIEHAEAEWLVNRVHQHNER